MTLRILFTALIAALAMPAIAAPGASEPGYSWRVLSVFPTVMTMVGDPVTGPPTKRVVPTLVVLDKRDDHGVDYEIAWYDVNCETGMIRNHSNMLYGARTEPTKSLTDDVEEPYADDPYFSSIANFACNGVRESDDESSFSTDAEAFAYGRKLAAAATAAENR
jgi:hypothetical protein